MSTKIHDAFRIGKSHSLTDLIHSMREITASNIADDHNYLKSFHLLGQRANRDAHMNAQHFLRKNQEGQTYFPYLCEKLDESDRSNYRADLSITFEATIFEDKRYYYFKFFPNEKWMRKSITDFTEKFPFQDYSFSDSTDALPLNTSRRSYSAREKKWFKLLEKSDFTFNSSLKAVLMDIHFFKSIVEKHCWEQGGNYLKNLAYKFPALSF